MSKKYSSYIARHNEATPRPVTAPNLQVRPSQSALSPATEGWRVVPVEPTKKMLEVGFGPFLGAHDPAFSANEPCGPIWKAMLSAAPLPVGGGEEGDSGSDVAPAKAPVSEGRPTPDEVINKAAFLAWPDETEPTEFEGRTLIRITVNRGDLRYAFAMGANWMRGVAWAQTSIQGALPPPPLGDAVISAAPDLLEACQEFSRIADLLDRFEEFRGAPLQNVWGPKFAKVRAAIAKATGTPP